MIRLILQSSAILLVGFGVVYILRRRSASLRHLILTVALFAAVVVPVTGRFIPQPSPAPQIQLVVAGGGPWGQPPLPTTTAAEARSPVAIRGLTPLSPLSPATPYGFPIWIIGFALSLAEIQMGNP